MVNHKRLFRVYQEAGLRVRRREKKRLERGRAGMLPRALQSHLVQQHARHLRIIHRRFHMRWKKLQLLRLTLLVEPSREQVYTTSKFSESAIAAKGS
jgi:hypothetical protein